MSPVRRTCSTTARATSGTDSSDVRSKDAAVAVAVAAERTNGTPSSSRINRPWSAPAVSRQIRISCFEQPRQLDLAGQGLGRAQQARDIDIHGRLGRARRAHGRGRDSRELARERPHLGGRAPADIAADRIGEMSLGLVPQPDAQVEPATALVRERGILNKSFARRAIDRFLVQARRVERTLVEGRKLAGEQACLVQHILRTQLGPCFELAQVFVNCAEQRSPLADVSRASSDAAAVSAS